MDIIDFAMKMELDGKAFYEKAAARAQRREVKEIFGYLAEEEKRHYSFFRSLKEGADPDVAARELRGGSVASPKNIFVQLTVENDDQMFGEDIKGVWTEALKIEEKSAAFYSGQAQKEKYP